MKCEGCGEPAHERVADLIACLRNALAAERTRNEAVRLLSNDDLAQAALASATKAVQATPEFAALVQKHRRAIEVQQALMDKS